MKKRYTYIIAICCLGFTGVWGQTQKLNLLLDKVTQGISGVLEDQAIPDSCDKTFRNYEESFPRKSDKEITVNGLTQLMVTGNKLISVANETSKRGCNNEKINKLATLGRQLVDESKRLRDSLNRGPALVSFRIRVIDSSRNVPVTVKLRIDSQGRAIASRRITKTVTGSYDAMLLPNHTYRVRADAESFHVYQKDIVARNQDSLLVSLQSNKAILQPEPVDSTTAVDTAVIVTGADAAVSNAEDGLSAPGRNNTLLLVSVSVLFVLVIASVLLYINTSRKYRRLLKHTTMQTPLPDQQVQEEVAEAPEASLQFQDDLPAAAETNADELLSEDPEPLPLVPASIIAGTDAKHDPYFICEIMMTAGPRKKAMNEANSDKDLGEDVCGFVSNSNEVMLWLLDGTSDNHHLKNPVNRREYFSSRLLALSIAGKLRRDFSENSSISLKDMINRAIQEVRSDWLEVIDQLPEEEKQHVRMKIQDKIFPECSATILIAKLSINGDLIAYRSGDSKMFLFSTSSENETNFVETSLMQKNRDSDDRIFFSLCINADGKLDIVFNEPLYEIVPHKNIREIISFSDGIGMETERLLRSEYKNAPLRIRKDIMYHTQETGDDKSICFIEIKNNQPVIAPAQPTVTSSASI